MADEVRRSGRANKGHHTKNADALDEPIHKPKPKPKGEKKAATPADTSRAQSAASGEQNEEEDDAIYRCVCGDQREIRGREMIMCDKCEAWQHNKCLGLPDSSYWVDKTYLCERCKPEDHAELLAAMARGEKPWNRKKGSKAPRPKFRPSDAGSEAPQAKTETPTPQPTKDQPASSSSQPTPAAEEASKVTKKATPKSQPQSPLGEKRSHEAVAETEGTSAKRRKSSSHHQQAAPTGVAGSVDALPEKQRLITQALVNQLAPIITQVSNAGNYRIPDGDTPSSVATRFGLEIDHAVAAHWGVPTGNDSPYAQRYRQIISNLKRNPALVDRLLNKSLLANDLATMPVEEMASEEKQREYAAIKEASERQMVLTDEAGPRLRKTHKGEELVGEDNMDAEPEFKPPEPRPRPSIDEGKTEGQTFTQEEGGPVVELPESVARGTPLAVETKSPTTHDDSARRPSTTFDINSVFDKVRSPQHDQQTFLHRRQSSIRPQQTTQGGPVVDADIDRLLKDEDNDVEMSGFSDPSIVWRGAVELQHFRFEAVARCIAGGNFGKVIPWNQLLPPTIPIGGRIPNTDGNNYIQGLAGLSMTQPTTCPDVSVLTLSPVAPEDEPGFEGVLNYFLSKSRWGVVPAEHFTHDALRDIYIVPLEAGGGPMPGFLDLLEECYIETIRPNPMLLLAMVAKLPMVKYEPQIAQAGQPITSTSSGGQAPHPAPVNNGPVSTPYPPPAVNHHAPQYSPVQPSISHGAPFGAPQAPPASTASPPVPNPAHMHHPVPAHGYPQQHAGSNGHYAPPQQGFPQQHLPYQQPHQQAPPVQPHFPQQPPQQPAPPQFNPKALEIFGEFITAPVIVQFLSHDPNMAEPLMRNLRHILEIDPAARNDMNAVMRHLQGGQGSTQQG